MIDTALLMAGVLTAREYFTARAAPETELREIADELYRRVDWRWSQNGGAAIAQGWKPESGFLHYGWQGYSEGVVLYVLASGFPTHPILGDAYDAWTVTYQWENLHGYDLLYAGPVFIYQFSQAWIDMRGVQDPFMRDKGSARVSRGDSARDLVASGIHVFFGDSYYPTLSREMVSRYAWTPALSECEWKAARSSSICSTDAGA